jgi:hypothetical protein
MGQLDEAIRAHLELKRKHGASDEELQAEEQEALGPVRREPASEPAAEAVGENDLDVEEEPALAAPQASEEPPEAFEPEAFDEGADLTERLEHADLTDPLERADLTEPLPPAGEEPAFEPDDPMDPLDPREPDPEPAAGATPPRGFDVVTEPDLDEEEDVLEETPDFLQETPEHDRLWFEQKPPRDFDFDE